MKHELFCEVRCFTQQVDKEDPEMTDNTKAHVDKLVARNSHAAKAMEEERTPLLGIFWIHPKTNKVIEPYKEPLEHGREDHELKVTDATTTHPNTWNLVKHHHPDLSSLKYDQVPRGRVFYNHETKKFHVWGPESHLKDPDIKGQILLNYNLSESNGL
jgi:hypothetical protein